MPPSTNIVLALVSLFDAAIFWVIGQAIAAGRLKKPMPSNWTDEEKAHREQQNRKGGVAVMQAAPWLVVLGLMVLVLPLPQQQLVFAYVAGLLAIVGWILYNVFVLSQSRPDDRGAAMRSGDDPDLPIR